MQTRSQTQLPRRPVRDEWKSCFVELIDDATHRSGIQSRIVRDGGREENYRGCEFRSTQMYAELDTRRETGAPDKPVEHHEPDWRVQVEEQRPRAQDRPEASDEHPVVEDLATGHVSILPEPRAHAVPVHPVELYE